MAGQKKTQGDITKTKQYKKTKINTAEVQNRMEIHTAGTKSKRKNRVKRKRRL